MVGTLAACDDGIRLLVWLLRRECRSREETILWNLTEGCCSLISDFLCVRDGLADDREDFFLQLFHILEIHVILKISQVFLQLIDHFLLIVRRLSHHGVVHGAVAVALQHHHSTVGQVGLSVLFL